MHKIKLKKVWSNILLLVSLLLIIYSTINIYIWWKDNKKTQEILNDIENRIKITEKEDDSNTQIISQDDLEEDNPYWDYIKMNLIDVDFQELKEINNETVGWIQVGGTNINYPFVQGKNNEYYLTHSFDKSYNSGGWVFLDYRNNIVNLNNNTIIYAHNRKDKSMFGSLKNSLNKKWLNNTSNHIIKISTEKANSLWQIFSIYHIPTTNDYLQIYFSSNSEFLEFINLIKGRSMFNFDTSVLQTDKILSLSTCYNSSEKLVVHAKLIKIENKTEN